MMTKLIRFRTKATQVIRTFLENNFNSWEDVCVFSVMALGYVLSLYFLTQLAYARGHWDGFDRGQALGFRAGFQSGATTQELDTVMNQVLNLSNWQSSTTMSK
jgi:hypothetical protein